MEGPQQEEWLSNQLSGGSRIGRTPVDRKLTLGRSQNVFGQRGLYCHPSLFPQVSINGDNSYLIGTLKELNER